MEMHKSRGNGDSIRHNSEGGIIRGTRTGDCKIVLGIVGQEKVEIVCEGERARLGIARPEAGRHTNFNEANFHCSGKTGANK